MEDRKMATNSDSGGAFGMVGVLLGAVIVLLIGGFFLMNSGMLGNQSSTVKLELPKVSGTK
jgi:hypothetical protein